MPRVKPQAYEASEHKQVRMSAVSGEIRMKISMGNAQLRDKHDDVGLNLTTVNTKPKRKMSSVLNHS